MKGAFGLAETHMYLKKQGPRVVIGGNLQTSEWRKYDVDSGGNQLMTSLCPETGERKQNHSGCDFQKKTNLSKKHVEVLHL